MKPKTKKMSQNVSKILTGAIAQNLADKLPNKVEVFRNGTDYYTYTDTAADFLPPSDYSNITIPQSVVDGTLPVSPVRKMFPR